MTIKPKKDFAHRRYENNRFDRNGGKHTKHASPSKERRKFNINDDIFVTEGPFKGKYGKYIRHNGGVNDLKVVMTFLGEPGYHYITASFVVPCQYELMNPIYDSSSVGTHGFKIEQGVVNKNIPGIVLKKGMWSVLTSIRFADGTMHRRRCLDFIDFHPFMIITKGRGRPRRLL